jgi:peptidoglycan hydrolase CwlO-like protein
LKLTRAVKTIIAEDSGASHRKRITELEEDKSTLQCAMDNGVEDYNLLLMGNHSLLAECNDFKYHCENLEKELAEVRSDIKKRITDLEVKVKSAKAHIIHVAAADKKQ